jgi:hypothetical protein
MVEAAVVFDRSKPITSPTRPLRRAFLLAFGLIAPHGPLAVFRMAWPFAVWSWLMSWALLAQHTHPRVPWFDDERHGARRRRGHPVTVHVVAPGR